MNGKKYKEVYQLTKYDKEKMKYIHKFLKPHNIMGAEKPYWLNLLYKG
jgi:hypothetical protein